jgi:hypothetical protein
MPPPAELTIGKAIRSSHERLRTVAKTVADGCEQKRNVERTHPQPPNPQSETGTLATHSGKIVPGPLEDDTEKEEPEEETEGTPRKVLRRIGKVMKSSTPAVAGVAAALATKSREQEQPRLPSLLSLTSMKIQHKTKQWTMMLGVQ